jgi:hypothetical protein
VLTDTLGLSQLPLWTLPEDAGDDESGPDRQEHHWHHD